LRSIRRRFQGFEFEITQEAGLSPAFGFIDVQVIELVLQSLLERSREKQP
jgi:hypothetical protein